VRCWGQNDTRQLGLGNTTDMAGQVGSAINLGSGLTATAISASYGYACAVLSNGMVRCWGDNSNGWLGLGNTSAVLSGTVALASGAVATSVATGGGSACALISGGFIHCWGDNYSGEFGLGSQTPLRNQQLQFHQVMAMLVLRVVEPRPASASVLRLAAPVLMMARLNVGATTVRGSLD